LSLQLHEEDIFFYEKEEKRPNIVSHCPFGEFVPKALKRTSMPSDKTPLGEEENLEKSSW
jgi:hypothetical protein